MAKSSIRYRKTKRKTKKITDVIPSLKILKKDDHLYGSKNKDIGYKILEYTKSNEVKKKI